MKLIDLLENGTSYKIRADIQNSLPPTFVIPELQNSDAYRQYRHSVALAAARSTKDSNNHVDSEVAWGQDQSVICYTPEDIETLEIANKLMGVTSVPLTNTASKELNTRQTVSPVRKFVDFIQETVIINNMNKIDNPHTHGTISKLSLSSASADKLYNWCIKNNIECIAPEKFHCTVLFSRKPVTKLTALDHSNVNVTAKIKDWKVLGPALTLELESPSIVKLHKWMINQGGTHDYQEFIVHTSVTYNWSSSNQLPNNLPDFDLTFDKLEVEAIDPAYAVESSK